MSGGFEPTGSEKKGIRDVYMEKRLFDDDTTIISARAYNLIIGVMIALGFAIDFFMAYELSNLILRIPLHMKDTPHRGSQVNTPQPSVQFFCSFPFAQMQIGRAHV